MERAEKPYPYAQPRTFEFLKDAIAEGAHLKVPKTLARYPDAEDAWVKQRNIAGTYFTCVATIYDIGETYGYASGASPSLIIRKFIKHLWQNSSIDIRAKYPLREIQIQKPQTKRSMLKRSTSRGGILQKVDVLIAEGKTVGEIVKSVGRPRVTVNSAIRMLGREDLIGDAREKNRKLVEEVRHLPDDFEKRQAIIDKAGRRFIQRYPWHFMSVTDTLRHFGMQRRKGKNLDAIEKELKGRGIAVRLIEGQPGKRSFYIFREDMEKAFGEAVTNPS
ncbi:MAG: hypothetical protein UV59_C0030G0008 [Candidatus Gottesmanbacteria bacterium GW2011_GWA1_43_11]|uniref:Uncharacterized protein n=1 Tax=Candidatus Gottesmanbacteria bacterium GW2011_GWA1_43_11 TaxID=1618436 RepID=A0A0G1CDY4_9BACT|nr:MAG: hypothetical protein UV59_C0030G0008 [Candidatus Gottesmanbacteria bacterium GW2011_GWA1_43_11]